MKIERKTVSETVRDIDQKLGTAISEGVNKVVEGAGGFILELTESKSAPQKFQEREAEQDFGLER